MSDARLRLLERAFRAEPTAENALRWATAYCGLAAEAPLDGEQEALIQRIAKGQNRELQTMRYTLERIQSNLTALFSERSALLPEAPEVAQGSDRPPNTIQLSSLRSTPRRWGLDPLEATRPLDTRVDHLLHALTVDEPLYLKAQDMLHLRVRWGELGYQQAVPRYYFTQSAIPLPTVCATVAQSIGREFTDRLRRHFHVGGT